VEERPSRTRDLVHEVSVIDLQRLMETGEATSVMLVRAYLARMAAYDADGPALNAIIRLNPRAEQDADRLDTERARGRVRGALHGVPVLLKDNFSTRDMMTTNGSIAFAGLQTDFDAFQVTQLREAGAVILGKTNMHELASGITNISSIGGQTRNPYDPDRLPGGSSGGSGAAVAASFCAIAWGSDTCGSIRIPAAVQNLYGLRPTHGYSSTRGVVPLSHSQDVAGPLARTVRDLAIALDATSAFDASDVSMRDIAQRDRPSVVAVLDAIDAKGVGCGNALAIAPFAGRRIGVLGLLFGEESDDAEGNGIVRGAVARLAAHGATVIDVEIPGLADAVAAGGVIPYEFAPDLADFLATIPRAPVRSLSEILERGLCHVQLREILERRAASGSRDGAAYEEALAARGVARALVTDCLDAGALDALVYPALRRKAALIGEPQRGNTCMLAAVTGLPALSLPAGFTPDGLPIGIELLGRPMADAELVGLAYCIEGRAGLRRAPDTTPPLVSGVAPEPELWRASGAFGAVTVRGMFAFDITRRTLTYEVAVTGASDGDVFGINLVTESNGKRVVVHGLSSRGVLRLGHAERRALALGEASVVAYVRGAEVCAAVRRDE
jgi:amidase